MSEAGHKAELDLARIEQTLLASIKLMKRGRREMERMRRKSSRHDHDQEHDRQEHAGSRTAA